jgi:hypothetical protein
MDSIILDFAQAKQFSDVARAVWSEKTLQTTFPPFNREKAMPAEDQDI